MTRIRLIPILIALMVVGTGISVDAQPVSVCDYTPPTNQLTQLTLSGEYNQFEDRYLDDRNNVNSGNIMLDGLAWSQRENWSYNLDGQVDLRISPEGVELDSALSSDGQARYFLQGDTFAFGGVTSSGLPGSGITVSGLAGAGIGQFRNVTPMAKAIRIAQTLQAQEILDEFPAEETMNKLAQVIGSTRSMNTAEMLREIESLFETSFDVDAVLALQSVINADLTRFCGWNATAGLGYPLVNPDDEDNPFVRAQVNYALPLDPEGRMLVRAEGQAPLPFEGGYNVNASADYYRTLSPTSTLTATYQYTLVQEPTGNNYTTHTVNLTLSGQVQPSLNVTANAQASVGDRYEEPEWGFNLGFEYQVF